MILDTEIAEHLHVLEARISKYLAIVLEILIINSLIVAALTNLMMALLPFVVPVS